jgi:RNA polymerase sigma-32 factor
MSFLDYYLSEVARYPLLTAEEEQRLARIYRDGGDTRAAHALVTANLRFVVKVAYGYRSYGLRMADLIQEGNIGLMKSVQKFDPDLGIRLISYAVWWIRAYIQNYVLRSWSLVKVGTTQAQRKLFFSLARTRRELDRSSTTHGSDSDGNDPCKVARKLHVTAADVEEMQNRLDGRDLSLDVPVGEGGALHVDFVVSGREPQDDEIAAAEEHLLVARQVGEALAQLDPRERFIIEHRVMLDPPMTLKDLGEHYGFSRERARQLEIRAKEKLRHALHGLVERIAWTAGAPTGAGDAAVAQARP